MKQTQALLNQLKVGILLILVGFMYSPFFNDFNVILSLSSLGNINRTDEEPEFLILYDVTRRWNGVG